jgi:hypothetical protein
VFGSIRPLATGALCQIGGLTTVANYTGNDTLDAFDEVSLGLNTFSAGSFAFCCGLQDGSAEYDAVVRQYVEGRFGL